MSIELGRSITSDSRLAFRHEWLVTNGLGGYAMGTISGARTRRYHGLLIAALSPPTQRYLTLASVDAWLQIGDWRLPLITHEWAAGVVLPDGYNNLEHFELEGTMPVFRWSVGITSLEQRIWMANGRNTTYITWHYRRGQRPVRLLLKPLVTYRSHHDVSSGGAPFNVTTMPSSWSQGLELDILPSGYMGRMDIQTLPAPLRILTDRGNFAVGGDWWWSFLLAEERRRGLADQEDLYQVGTIEVMLEPGETIGLACTTEDAAPEPWSVALQHERDRQTALLDCAQVDNAPDWVRHLVLAADQFVVEKPDTKEAYIVGGYPWFSVWGRSTMVSLTGLTSIIGRTEMAASVLQTFARFANRGMLPNTLSDYTGEPAYNSVDTSLWFYIAIWAYLRESPDDLDLLHSFYPLLVEIIDNYRQGVRYGIHEDPADGLLYGGEVGVQLTWMDVKIDDWVVTPRMGKAVEVNALWYNALCIMQDFATRLNLPEDARAYAAKAHQVKQSFDARFWCDECGYLYDVIDVLNAPPHTNDSTLRPNQLLTLSLPFRLLQDQDRARKVVDICARELLTSYGLRTLSRSSDDYLGNYGGSPERRDSAYHQGTAWGWLIGPFVSAHLAVYNDPETARTFLEPFADHLYDQGLGTIAEIFDGNPPFRPQGAIAEAWSVSEVLRTWYEIERHAR